MSLSSINTFVFSGRILPHPGFPSVAPYMCKILPVCIDIVPLLQIGPGTKAFDLVTRAISQSADGINKKRAYLRTKQIAVL